MRWITGTFLALLLLAPVSGQTFRDWAKVDGSITHMAVDAQGYVYLFGNPQPYDQNAFVARLAPDGSLVYRVTVATGGAELSGIAVDEQGNAYIAGWNVQGSLPVIHALQPEPPDTRYAQSFIAKLNADGSVAWATYFGGEGENFVRAIAADTAGNVYVTGSTNAPDFPVTPGAIQKEGAVSQASTAFVAKLSTGGDKVLYGTYLGGRTTDCSKERALCYKFEQGNSIKVDAAGNAYVVGSTNAKDFPLTPGALQTICQCDETLAAPLVAKLNASGTALVYSTYFVMPRPPGFPPSSGESVDAIAIDSAGATFLAGSTANPQFPTTPGAFQNHLQGTSNAFVAKLNSAGTALSYSTYLGGSGYEMVYGIAVDGDGNTWVNGVASSPDFPNTTNAFVAGGNFVTQVNAAGTAVLNSVRLPWDFADGQLALGIEGGVFLNSVSHVSQLNPRGGAEPSIVMVTSDGTAKLAMQYAVPHEQVSPGELVSIFGFRIGPQQPAAFELDGSGRVASALAGVRIFFDEIPAPLLYVESDHIEAVTPFEIAGRESVHIHVEVNGAGSPQLTVGVSDAAPGLFVNADYFVVAFNEDGSVNSADHPAKPGSIILFYATGLGVTMPPSVDGEFATARLPAPVLPVSVWNAELLDVGAAPGMVAGIMQIKTRLRDAPFPRCSTYSIGLQVGSWSSIAGFIFVAPPPFGC